MTKVKLNLVSGSVQEREVITSFKYNDVKYIIFDGESTGSMGLPIILVCKEVLGKVVGITDAEEWKTTKECLKKIISGEKLEYISVSPELKADDIYYRQLTLPVASFDVLKTSYVAPEVIEQSVDATSNTPVFEQITPEDIASTDMSQINPVPAATLNTEAAPEFTQVPEGSPDVNSDAVSMDAPIISEAPAVDNPVTAENVSQSDTNTLNTSYETLKAEYMSKAEALFNELYEKISHND